MGELIVVTGPPGAGKSTVAGLLADTLNPSALVPGDEFFAFLRRGFVDPWLPAAHEQNTAIIQAAAAGAGRLARYCDVVYDGVLIPAFRSAFLSDAQVDHLHYALLLPPLAVCLERVATRTGHGFTDLAAAEHMWREFRQGQSGDGLDFDPADAGPEVIAQRIAARVADGSIRFPPLE